MALEKLAVAIRPGAEYLHQCGGRFRLLTTAEHSRSKQVLVVMERVGGRASGQSVAYPLAEFAFHFEPAPIDEPGTVAAAADRGAAGHISDKRG